MGEGRGKLLSWSLPWIKYIFSIKKYPNAQKLLRILHSFYSQCTSVLSNLRFFFFFFKLNIDSLISWIPLKLLSCVYFAPHDHALRGPFFTIPRSLQRIPLMHDSNYLWTTQLSAWLLLQRSSFRIKKNSVCFLFPFCAENIQSQTSNHNGFNHFFFYLFQKTCM